MTLLTFDKQSNGRRTAVESKSNRSCKWPSCWLQTRRGPGGRMRSTVATTTSFCLASTWNETSNVISSSRPASTTAICTEPAYSRSVRSPKRCATFTRHIHRCRFCGGGKGCHGPQNSAWHLVCTHFSCAKMQGSSRYIKLIKKFCTYAK